MATVAAWKNAFYKRVREGLKKSGYMDFYTPDNGLIRLTYTTQDDIDGLNPETGKPYTWKIDILRYSVDGIPVVSETNFTRLTGICISHLTGKMEDMSAITTGTHNNKTCMEKIAHATPNNACFHCFGESIDKQYKDSMTAHDVNTEALSCILPVLPDLSKYQTFRFNTQGELTGPINAINYYYIIRANTNTHFGFWTKCPEYTEKALETLDICKPCNVNMIYSSPILDYIPNIDELKQLYPRTNFDSTFVCVWDLNRIDPVLYRCHCEKGSCKRTCAVCYSAEKMPSVIIEAIRPNKQKMKLLGYCAGNCNKCKSCKY